jgi:hypothetical protein
MNQYDKEQLESIFSVLKLSNNRKYSYPFQPTSYDNGVLTGYNMALAEIGEFIRGWNTTYESQSNNVSAVELFEFAQRYDVAIDTTKNVTTFSWNSENHGSFMTTVRADVRDADSVNAIMSLIRKSKEYCV